MHSETPFEMEPQQQWSCEEQRRSGEKQCRGVQQFETPSQNMFSQGEDCQTADTLKSSSLSNLDQCNYSSNSQLSSSQQQQYLGGVFEGEDAARLAQQMSDFSLLSPEDQKQQYLELSKLLYDNSSAGSCGGSSSSIQSSWKSYSSSNNQNQTTTNSDRFIPNRRSSKLHVALTGAHETTDENKIHPESLKGKEYKEQNQFSVLQLYKAHVLGLSNAAPYYEAGGAGRGLLVPSQTNNNIFRFKDAASSSCLGGHGQGNARQPLGSILGSLAQDPLNLLCSSGFSGGGSDENIMLQGGGANGAGQYYSSTQQPYYHTPAAKKPARKISKIPFKVLDAPSLQDDFYLNLVDWSQQNNLAVALASCVYLWSASNNKVVKFCDLGLNDMVTSVTWNPRGTVLCIGTSFGDIQIWDAVKLKKCCTLSGHTARVGALAWSNIMLSSGSRDKTILQRDLRTELNYVKKLSGHRQEVCGLRWSYDDQQLASGGNDNKLFVWNLHNANPVAKFSQHCAAVKALAWSPHQHGLLASGGGTADRTIRFWNTLNNQQLDYYDTGSQVCNLLFSKNVNELVSTHGYSLNQVVIWKYPSMERVVDLTGHTSRVLFLSMSPDGETIVTGAGDETLRFWSVFPKRNEGVERSSLLVGNMRDLR